MDGAPDGVISYQPIYHNAVASRLLGFTDAEFDQQTLFEQFPSGLTCAHQHLPLINHDEPFHYE